VALGEIKTHGWSGYCRDCRCDTCTDGAREHAAKRRLTMGQTPRLMIDDLIDIIGEVLHA
jgi:hypothetical protein